MRKTKIATEITPHPDSTPLKKKPGIPSKILKSFSELTIPVKVVIITGIFGCITTMITGMFGIVTETLKNSHAQIPSPTVETAKFLLPIRISSGPSTLAEPCTYNNEYLLPEDINPVEDLQAAHQEIISRELNDNNASSLSILNRTLSQLTVTSIVDDEWVKVSNKVIVHVNTYRSLPGPSNVLAFPCGGAGVTRDFPIISVSNRTDVNFTQTIPGIDFFTLQPGEFEVFDIEITALVAGYYELTVGIEYTYKGTTSTFWLPEKLYLYTPNETQDWLWWGDEILPGFNGKRVFNSGNYEDVPSP